MENPSQTDLLSKGAELFNRAEYWLAHEAWEKVWLSLAGEDRVHLQGFIQACGCFYHLQENHEGPAVAVGRLALEKIKHVPQRPLVDISGLEEVLKQIVSEKRENDSYLEQAKLLIARVISY